MNTREQNRNREDEQVESTRERPLVAPLMDIYENNDELLLVADLPGISQEQVQIDLHKNRLTVAARRGELDARSPEGEFLRFDFHRSFIVPNGLDAERVTAELTNGVLRIHLPKQQQNRPRRIEVRTS